ncbi:hypothetical protein [Polyangium sp. 6x1]|uniref:hypothetical protein n=1 Tax=Polyangium sp. 6x1 TaxID=3042689 RepID=UPI0024831834|nr:hypothetical protein [Polyangium sp. 6x1]MDI1451900.1 hypothetical protein [Polyangium sp. 6x1]
MKPFPAVVTMGLTAIALAGCSDHERDTRESPEESAAVLCPETGPLTGANLFSRVFVVDTEFRAMGLGVGVDGASHTVVAGAFRQNVDPGGGPIASAGGYDLFVAKFDPAGALLWSHRFGGPGDESFGALAVGERGDIWLVSHGSLAGGEGFLSVIALDPAGNERFSRSYTGAEYQTAKAAAVDREGNLLLVGSYAGSQFDLGLGPIGKYGYNFLAKFNAAGETTFVRALAGSSDDFVSDVAAAPDGEVVLTGALKSVLSLDGIEGASAGGTDVFAARFSAKGEPRWIRRFGSADDWEEGKNVAVDALGNTWLTGSSSSLIDLGRGPIFPTAGGSTPFVVELDAAGRPLRHRLDVPRHVRADGAGNVVLAGEFAGTLDPGSGPLASAGGTDAWLVKLGRAGEVRWAERMGNAQSEAVHGLAMNCKGGSAIVGSRVDPNEPNVGALDGPIEVFVSVFAP